MMTSTSACSRVGGVVVGCGCAPTRVWGVWGHLWVCVSGGVLLSHTLACAVPSALGGLTSGFGMGPGVSLSLWPPEQVRDIKIIICFCCGVCFGIPHSGRE